MKLTITSLVVFCALLIGVPFTSPVRAQGRPNENATTLIARAGQLTKTQIESPRLHNPIQVINRTNAVGDVDFSVVDSQGNEVARETVTVDPKLTATFVVQEVFPELVLADVGTVHVQVSVRPEDGDRSAGKDKEEITPQAAQLAVAFFSQRNSAWSSQQLGTCAGTTIGSAGCAITAIAMAGARSVTNFNPSSLNTYLKNNTGYSSGCLVIWSAAANIDGPGGFTYHGTGTGSVGNAANLKALIDGSKFAIVRSARFSSHFGIIIGYYNTGSTLSDFYYLDPWDTSAVFRRVNDGWVSSTSATRIYQ